MNCPQCSTSMVQAQATSYGEQYWYCRGCKKELGEMQNSCANALKEPTGQAEPGYTSRARIVSFVLDTGKLEKCRMIQGQPTHFWHDETPSPCQCQAYVGNYGDSQVMESQSGVMMYVGNWGRTHHRHAVNPQTLPRPTGASPALSAPYGATPVPCPPPPGVFMVGQRAEWLGIIGRIIRTGKLGSGRKIIKVQFDVGELRNACQINGCYVSPLSSQNFYADTGLRMLLNGRAKGKDLTEQVKPWLNALGTQNSHISTGQGMQQLSPLVNYVAEAPVMGEYSQSDTDLTLRFMKEWARLERPQIAESLRKKGWNVSEEEDK